MRCASARAPRRCLRIVGALAPPRRRSVPQTRGSALAPPRRPGQPASWLRIGGATVSNIFPMALCHGCALALPRRPSRQSSVPMVPGQQQLRHNVPASSPLCRRLPCQQLRQGCASPQALCHSSASHQAIRHNCASHQAIRHGAPASNKPHSAEKSTAVWLAIWRIWAGFANSQLWRATFRSTYLYMCPSALLPL